MSEGNDGRLPRELVERIDALRARYPTEEALVLPALHLVQRHNGGWLSEESIEQVADLLHLSPAKVAGVVSFYDMFHEHPVGRHRIRLCTNLSCQLRGAEELLALLREELGVGEGEITSDGRCSFVQFECLGSCDTAPMAMVDDDYHENLTPARLRRIVQELD
ncbi:MAG: NADH-quinone oxidoreductase subunit NuoE [Acidobacteria bacterium]|nr:NADH-quinone oxidoreductase subunit NuoE [Acidobacteriota bacterium]MCB9377988.1 NADH-quinone oxidoreductase subunit NuoE [Holophagales bacterium]